MPGLIQSYFDFAQLSMAAYGSLTPEISGEDYTDELEATGFTAQLAANFSTRYAVRSVSDPSLSGFSATLFERLGVSENDPSRWVLAIRGTNDAADVLVDLVSVALAKKKTVAVRIQDPNATVRERHGPDCASSEFSAADR
jgi:hypothetical protein